MPLERNTFNPRSGVHCKKKLLTMKKKVGDRIHVEIPDASKIDREVFSKTPLNIDGTIIEDLGINWLVQLDISIGGKKYEVSISK